MNDVRKTIYISIIGFFGVLVFWISIVYVSSCGFTLTCHRGALEVERTPIPTLIPVSHSGTNMDAGMAMPEDEKCQVPALDLVGAWVAADSPETEPFVFTDINGESCDGSYAGDIQPLFVENSVWQPGSLGCVSCHNGDLSNRSAGLDMTSYASLQMGSQRADAASNGNDIFGGGNWEKSVLYDFLSNQGLTPDGHSSDVTAGNPLIFAGTQATAEAEATPSP